MVDTSTIASKSKNLKKRIFNMERDCGPIEPVSYEQNQHLLRAFGGQTMMGGGVQQGMTLHKHAFKGHTSKIGISPMSGFKPSQNVREPTYCFCNNVSYGDMIACDNKACPYEWFHFPCVGLTQKPDGKWFCQKCLLSLPGVSGYSISGQGISNNAQASLLGSSSRQNQANSSPKVKR